MDPFAGSDSDPQSLHKYLYCHANPINNCDPLGLMSLPEINVAGLIQTALFMINVAGFVYHAGMVGKSIFGVVTAFLRGDFWDGLAHVVNAIVNGIFAALSMVGMRAALIPPAPPCGAPALALAGGGAAAVGGYWTVIMANKQLAWWVIEQVAPAAFNAYLFMSKSSNGEGSVESHHGVPYNNKTYDHQNHPLVKQALVDLEKDPRNRMLLGNHGGRHSSEYHQQIKKMLDNAYTSVAGQGVEAAKKAFYEVCDDIKSGIANGELKPYKGKDVYIPGE